MDSAHLIDAVTRELEQEPLFLGLFLSGSHGRGAADAWSDVDLVAVVEAGAQSMALFRWIQLLEALTPVVYWNQRGVDPLLLNAITIDWLRCDLLIASPETLAGQGRDSVRVLIDREGVANLLAASAPPRSADPDRVRRLIDEFLRVLGLLHVVVGREEWLLAAAGAGELRDTFAELMLEQRSPQVRGGALRLRTLLSEEQRAVLESLPFPGPRRDEVIAAHFELARTFLPFARAMAATLGVPWPRRFEAATLDLLARECGESGRFDWRALRA